MEIHTGTDAATASAADTLTLRYEIDPEEPPSLALVSVLSELMGCDSGEIGPLGDYVDLEALDQLLTPRGRARPWTTSVRFVYDTFAMRIDRGEIVVVARDENGRTPKWDEAGA